MAADGCLRCFKDFACQVFKGGACSRRITCACFSLPRSVVSRRHLAAQAAVAERLAAVAARGGSYGVPEATLRESHRQMVQGSEYSHIFKPEEVAEIFAGGWGRPGPARCGWLAGIALYPCSPPPSCFPPTTPRPGTPCRGSCGRHCRHRCAGALPLH